MWGRLIGLTFFLPLLFFVFKGFVSKKLGVILTFILGLGCLQGFMGWYMVSSGLIDRPDVSQYRLAAHLGLAFLIYTLLIFIGWSLFQKILCPLFKINVNKIIYSNISSLVIFYCL